MSLSISELRARFPKPGPAELDLIARYATLLQTPQRARAFEAFAATGLPHRRMEAWKWSDLRQALGHVCASPAGARSALSVEGAVALRVSPQGFAFPDVLPDGIKLHRRQSPEALSDAEELPLGAMTAALAGQAGGDDGLIIEVTETVDTPLHLIFQGDQNAVHFTRLAIVVRPKARLTVYESHLGGAGFSSGLIQITVGDGSVLNRTLLQRGSVDEVQAVTSLVDLGAEAHYTQTQLAFGAKLARLETRLRHQESHSHAALNAAYLCGDGYHADFTSHVRHGAPSSITRQITKGAVLKGGRGVFQGKFLVPRTVGQYTDADMQHQALLLEEGAEVFAKPELEIYADDVACAHGNTSGALDDAQLFYMRQRGIPLAEARALLTEAFIAEAFGEAPGSVEPALRAAAHAFLSGAV